MTILEEKGDIWRYHDFGNNRRIMLYAIKFIIITQMFANSFIWEQKWKIGRSNYMDDVYRVYRVYSKQQTYQARKVELSTLITLSYDTEQNGLSQKP